MSPQARQDSHVQPIPHWQEVLPGAPVVSSLFGHVHGLQLQCSPHEHVLWSVIVPSASEVVHLFIILEIHAYNDKLYGQKKRFTIISIIFIVAGSCIRPTCNPPRPGMEQHSHICRRRQLQLARVPRPFSLLK